MEIRVRTLIERLSLLKGALKRDKKNQGGREEHRGVEIVGGCSTVYLRDEKQGVNLLLCVINWQN